MNKRYRPREAKREGLSIHQVFEIIQYEKKTAIITTRLEPSLRNFIMEHGGSPKTRELILEALAQRQEVGER